MNKTLLALGVITIVLLAYALKTAQLPAASVDYEEVFYIKNQSVTFITKDGAGLFGMKINPYVDSFKLEIIFPQGTEYLIKYGDKNIKGKDKFEYKVSKEDLPKEVIYVQFWLPEDVTKTVIFEKQEATIQIRMIKLPFWKSNETIYIKYMKNEK
ncbi:hypothetical protein E3E31_06935 [Thermococcus sp. M39]|uniref:hypothetical protein n=1 Tax=unclassified Thermococcus TaxID=2627626 RepID=UPI00143B1B90|nr:MULTISPECIES: hypothetical protein [unclassified Thermococcus]NJE08257.1 hypothetical protein [Thermococcus sp. M39]NJE11750.1 hypothetical protein [Thermococcus sp. LS2]